MRIGYSSVVGLLNEIMSCNSNDLLSIVFKDFTVFFIIFMYMSFNWHFGHGDWYTSWCLYVLVLDYNNRKQSMVQSARRAYVLIWPSTIMVHYSVVHEYQYIHPWIRSSRKKHTAVSGLAFNTRHDMLWLSVKYIS